MNSHLKINLIISLFIFSCSEDKTQIISNIPSDLPNQNYKINLHSNSGSFLENVTIYWNGTAGVVALYDSGTPINPDGSTYTFNDMIPGEFRDITIQVIRDDSTYVDSIQIFTRPIYPVSNFRYEVEMVMRGNGLYDDGESFTDLNSNYVWDDGEDFIDKMEKNYHRILSWTATIEPDETFSNYVIYRADNDNADILINPKYCDCEIATLTKSDTSFIDSMVTEESGIFAYFYQIRVNSGIDGRNSYIYNYTNFQSLPQIALAYSNVSKIYNKFIQITWGTVSNSTYFYQYEIWRASEEDSDDMQRLVIIIDPEQDKFMDRNVGTGTTYNYSVAVVDINGNRVFSDFVSGWSLP
jgi:hypothetical protein